MIRGSHTLHSRTNGSRWRRALRPALQAGLGCFGLALAFTAGCAKAISDSADSEDVVVGGAAATGGKPHTEPGPGGAPAAAGGTLPIATGGSGAGGQGGNPSTECEPGFAFSDGKCTECSPGQYCSGLDSGADCGDGSWDNDGDPSTPCASPTITEADCAPSYEYEAAADAEDAYCVRDGWTRRWSIPIWPGFPWTEDSLGLDRVKFHSTGEVLALGHRGESRKLIRISAETGEFEWELPFGPASARDCEYGEAPDHNLLVACAAADGLALTQVAWPGGEITWNVQLDVAEGDVTTVAFDGSDAAIVQLVSDREVTAHRLSWLDGSLLESAPGKLPSSLTDGEEDSLSKLALSVSSATFIEPEYTERGLTRDAQGVISTPYGDALGDTDAQGFFWAADLASRHLDVHECLAFAPSQDASEFGPAGQFVEIAWSSYPDEEATDLALYWPNPK